MMNGHTSGEGQRMDTYSGSTVYSLLADYQIGANGGDGWLRILEFSPATDEIFVKTYSPTPHASTYDPDGDGYEEDADSQFTLTYDMDAGAPFQ